MKKKKIIALICLILMFSSFAIPTFANSNVSFNFNSYEHNQGFIDGSANGIFYSLANRTHVLHVNYKSGSGTIYATLRRSVAGIDPIYGTASVSSPGSFVLKSGPADSNYYFYATGSQARTYYSLSGEVY